MRSIFAKLPTLASRLGGPQPKGATPTRLQAKVAREVDDARQLRVWRDQVFDRDQGICRCCGVKVIRLAVTRLHPRRAESHHIAGRDDQVTRYDTRNGALVCLKCHQRITGVVNDKLTIIGTVFFVKGGQRYINGDYPITFQDQARDAQTRAK